MEVRCPGNRFDAWRPVVTSAGGVGVADAVLLRRHPEQETVWRTTHKLMAEISLRDYTRISAWWTRASSERVYALCEPKPEEKPVIIIPRE